MPDVTFVVSTAFLGRMRNAMVFENPVLQGQTQAVINEAARVRVRQMIRDWITAVERSQAAATAQQTITPPGDVEIT